MKNFILFSLLICSLSVYAQKKPLIEERQKVIKKASAAFDASMKGPEGKLYLFAKENNIKGTYDFKITLGDRGKVTSIFVLKREGGSIQMQNIVKDVVMAIRFDFKLPKNKDYSLKYQFKF